MALLYNKFYKFNGKIMNPKERLRVGKECERNLRLNVKKYKPLDKEILYTNNILIISITYDGTHVNKGIAAPTLQD